MASLTKQAREALPAEDFAVPDRRMLPIHDEAHVRMAWREVERTRGLTDAHKREARGHILARAETLGVETADWSRIKVLSIAAMALDMPKVDDHPNRMPFSGILTRLNQPSDVAPEGSGGRRVMVGTAAAEAALPSLLGMAVDYTPEFDGHDVRAKIGLITGATIDGDAVRIEGFFYAADFPDETARIRADKDVMGFSFEAQNLLVADPGADVLEITELAFTGAAVLLKQKAAYKTTSLAASAAEDIDMTKEEMIALLGENVTAPIAALAARMDKVEAAATAKIEASKSVMDKVEPHATALESCAAAIEADGIGCAASGGHVAHLKKMASSMRAAAAVGNMPHVYRDHDSYFASGTADALTKAVTAAMAPLATKLEAAEARADAAVKAAAEAAAVAETKIADATALAVKASAEPARKTLAPGITTLLAKAGVVTPEGDAKIEVSVLDAAFTKAGMTSAQRMQAKTGLAHAGLIA